MESPSTIKIFHWNVLDPAFSTPQDFPKVDPYNLPWEVRIIEITYIINNSDPDLFSLAEFPANKELILKDEYAYTYSKKPDLNHGVLCGFRKSAFKLLDKKIVFFENNNQKISQSFIYLKLIHTSGHTINFICTHLKSKKDKEIRKVSIQQLEDFIYKNELKKEALFVAGDFNAEPDEPAIFEFENKMQFTSILPDQFTTFKCYSGNDFKLVKRRIDYLFFDPKKCDLLEEWGMSKIVEKKEEWGCPSIDCPSDHLPISGTFNLKN